MSYGPITSWQISGEIMVIVTDVIFLGSQFTVDSDWSHEIKRCLLLGRKAMTNLDNIVKAKTSLYPQKSTSQSYGFSRSHVWVWELDHKECWVPMYHSFLIHSSADGHLGCCHVLAIVNSVVLNTGVHVSLSIMVSSLDKKAVVHIHNGI